MHVNDETRLDENVKRVDVGALVTLANVSMGTRQHYFISRGEDTTQPSLGMHHPVDVVTVDAPIAKALIGKMKGDKIFFRHDLVIEFIEWPNL